MSSFNSNRLQAWTPDICAASADWDAVLQPFWLSSTGQALAAFIQQRLEAGAVIYPALPLRALTLTPRSAVRVVILGQDPYHGPEQAEGLAFSVPVGQKCPPSLRNIWQEVVRDVGGQLPSNNSLLPWAQRGVLLLNTSLTVEHGRPASHAKRGWEELTDAIIAACSADGNPKVFMLWGAHAQAKRPLIDVERHLVLHANHPSPLSARRPPVPFAGCAHFSQARAWLEEKNQKNLQWL